MRLGWKVFLPLSLAFVVLTAGFMKTFDIQPWAYTEEAREIGRGAVIIEAPATTPEPVGTEDS
jgi:NADH-quinone oxidoreductase subunit H